MRYFNFSVKRWARRNSILAMLMGDGLVEDVETAQA